MIYFPIYASFCVALLEVTTSSSSDSVRRMNLFQLSNMEYLSAGRRKNLNEMLHFIHNSPEFSPLILSIITTDNSPDMAEFLSKYAATNYINLYQVKAHDLSLKNIWKWRTDITWVLATTHVHHLLALIYWQQDLWKPTNRYLIFFLNEDEPVFWRPIFDVLWQRYSVYRVLGASIHDDFQCLVKYLPFDISDGRFGGLHRICFNESFDSSLTSFHMNETAENTSLNEIDSVSLVQRNETLFETFQDLKNYKMNVVVFPSLMMNITYDKNKKPKFSMLDGNVMTLLERTLRVQFQVQILRKTGGDPFHHALRLIESGYAEMALTGFFTKTYDEYYKFEFSPGIYEDKLCFIAPSSGLVPKYYMLFKPFQKHVWLILLVYNIIITILWFLVGYLSKSFQNQQPIALPLAISPNSIRIRERTTRVFQCNASTSQGLEIGLNEFEPPSLDNFDSYIPGFAGPVFIRADERKNTVETLVADDPAEINPYVISCFDLVETACYPLQRANTSAQKAFLFGTLFFGLIVTGIYQSSLVSSLSKPFHYPEMDTLEEVVDSNMTIVTKYWNLKAWLAEDPLLGSTLKDRIDVVQSKIPTNHMVAYNKNVLALGRYASVKLDNLTVYYDDEGNKLLHIMEECPASYMLSYAIRQYSPYRERITAILLRMNEAGLVELWYRNLTYPYDVEMKRREVVHSERRIKLTLRHYSLTFLGLFIGLFCCTVVFLGELYFAGRLSRQTASGKS